MALLMDTIERDGNAFYRAFESAREFTCNPEARTGLRQAVAYAYLEGRTVSSRGDEAGGEFRLVLRRLDEVIRAFGLATRNMEA